MYSKYKQSLTKVDNESNLLKNYVNTPEHSKHEVNAVLHNIDGQPKDNVTEVVERCWDLVEDQIVRKEYNSHLHPSNTHHQHRWQTIRLLVSSTFSDFHNEREILVKKVFPALREWCEERRLRLIECDLRWGVPKDSTTATAISTCMEELDRCFHDNQGQPFFINMLSQRYGWIPNQNDLTDDIQDKYDWVDGVSITAMEILHGAYRTKNPNAVIFIRDPAFVKDLPEKHKKYFVDEEVLNSQHLKVLKDKLFSRFPEQVFEYKCHISGVDNISGRERVVFDDFGPFNDKVLSFFKAAIEKAYPVKENMQTQSEQELKNNLHQTFVDLKADMVIGRDKEVALLLDFAKSKIDPCFQRMEAGNKEEAMKYLENWNMIESDNHVLAVVAPPSSGKTSLLAQLVKEAKKEGLNVFWHFVGSDYRSNLPSDCIFRLISTIASDPRDPKIKSLEFEVEPNQRPVLIQQLGDLRHSKNQWLVIIDGLNEMVDSNMMHSTAWLPARFPANVRCIVSTTEHTIVLDRLQKRQAYKWNLNPIANETRQLITEHYLGRFNKRLDAEQLSLLLQLQGAAVPLWLILACEELRVFGDFRRVTDTIRTLPDSVEGLTGLIIDRLLNEDQTKSLLKLLCLIECSKAGLPEDDILLLLGSGKQNEALAPMTWATVRRSVKPFIQMISGGYLGLTNRLCFSHSCVGEVVREKYMSTDASVVKWHYYLADYYQYHCQNVTIVADELPHQLLKAKLHDRLVDFFRHDHKAITINSFYRRTYMNEICCSKPTFTRPNNRPPVLCNMCNNKTGLYQRGQKPSETCVLCGMWLHSTHPARKSAEICMQHSKLGPPKMDMCVECGQQVAGVHAPGHPVVICTWCYKINRCCKTV